jgi:RNA polymerase sigma-54 factor
VYTVELDLELRQRQELSLSPQLLEAMEILQMNTHELRGYILREMQENPVLEAEQTSPPYEDAALLARKLEWLDSLPGRRAEAAVAADDF